MYCKILMTYIKKIIGSDCFKESISCMIVLLKPNKKFETNDGFVYFVEFSNVYNVDRGPDVTQSNLLYNCLLKHCSIQILFAEQQKGLFAEFLSSESSKIKSAGVHNRMVLNSVKEFAPIHDQPL